MNVCKALFIEIFTKAPSPILQREVQNLIFWISLFFFFLLNPPLPSLVSLLYGSWTKAILSWFCHVAVFVWKRHVSSQINKPLRIGAVQILPWFYKDPLNGCLQAFLRAFPFYHGLDVYRWSGGEREGDGQVVREGGWVSEQRDTAGHRVCVCAMSGSPGCCGCWTASLVSTSHHISGVSSSLPQGVTTRNVPRHRWVFPEGRISPSWALQPKTGRWK